MEPAVCEKKIVFLIDATTSANALQKAIETCAIDETFIYCFCGATPPQIPLTLLSSYSQWLQKDRLVIIQPPAAATQQETNVTATLSYWAGKLSTTYEPEKARFVVSSLENFQTTAAWLVKSGFSVETTTAEVNNTVEKMTVSAAHVASLLRNQRLPVSQEGLTTLLTSMLPNCDISDIIKRLETGEYLRINSGDCVEYNPRFLVDRTQQTLSPEERRFKVSALPKFSSASSSSRIRY